MCKAGYRKANIKDAFGNDRVVCVNDFCGFYGEGTGCAGKVNLEGCDLSGSTMFNKTIVESCLRCSPGYWRFYEDYNNDRKWSCKP